MIFTHKNPVFISESTRIENGTICCVQYFRRKITVNAMMVIRCIYDNKIP